MFEKFMDNVEIEIDQLKLRRSVLEQENATLVAKKYFLEKRVTELRGQCRCMRWHGESSNEPGPAVNSARFYLCEGKINEGHLHDNIHQTIER